jgi:hypothetical protein
MGNFAFLRHLYSTQHVSYINYDKTIAKLLYHYCHQKMSCERPKLWEASSWTCLVLHWLPVIIPQTLETGSREYPFSEILTYNTKEHNDINYSFPVRHFLFILVRILQWHIKFTTMLSQVLFYFWTHPVSLRTTPFLAPTFHAFEKHFYHFKIRKFVKWFCFHPHDFKQQFREWN